MISKLVRPNFILSLALLLNIFIGNFTFVSINNSAQAAVTSAVKPHSVTTTNWKFDSLSTFYRTPFGAQPVGTAVTLHFQTDSSSANSVQVRLYDWKNGNQILPYMTKVATDNGIDYWSYTVQSPVQPDIIYYRFIINGSDGQTYYYEEQTSSTGGVGTIYTTSQDKSWQITYYDPNFQTPDWLKNAVIYQIFPDRFVNGDPSNDTLGMPKLETTTVTTHANWTDYPDEPGQGTDFFGGDLKGIDQKVNSGYFTSLGVNTIYLNPIFLSGSNHKYDTSDYLAIDPRFGTMADFDQLVSDIHAKNMHIILDGVFNHTADDSYYFNKYGHFNTSLPLDPNNPLANYSSTDGTYSGSGQGAYQDQSSPYYWWYDWINPGWPTYSCWAGYCSLPKLYPTQSNNQQPASNIPNEATYIITDVAKYYVSAHNVDAWRLDVANEINDEDTGDTQGNSPANHSFLAQFRSSVKAANPNAAIISEVWFNTSKWFLGDQMDSTMDYLFRDAIDGFLANGTDHDAQLDSNAHYSSSQFNVHLLSMMENYPPQVFSDLMNLVDSHDRPRVRWNLGDCDRTASAVNPGGDSGWANDYTQNCIYGVSPNASQENTINARNELIALMQFAYPGAPTIYYGDEVAMTGFRDPDTRRTYPTTLTTTNQTTIESYYSAAANMRNSNAALLATGSMTTLYINDTLGSYAFGRESSDGSQAAVVILNNNSSSQTLSIPVNNGAAGSLANFLPNGTSLTDISPANAKNFNVVNGAIAITLGAYQGVVLKATNLTQPNAPTSLQITSGFSKPVQLGWSAPSSGPTPTGYNVYRSYFKGGGYTFLGNTSTASYTDNTANSGVTYYYVIKATVNGLENSSATAYSNETSVTPRFTSTAPVQDGTINPGEYGVDTDGYNQQTNSASGTVWHVNWDDTNLYIGISGANVSEGAVVYIDKDPQTPINSGTGNGSFTGFNYDGEEVANLPFQADFVTYFKHGSPNYNEYRTNNGSGWSSNPIQYYATYADNNQFSSSGVREIAIPWSAITGGSGRPASFAWLGLLTSGGGYVYGTVPTANPTANIGTNATFNRYYIVNDTSNSASATYPFAHDSYALNSGSATNFGSINVWDFSVNSSGGGVTRSSDGQTWNIANNLYIKNGTVDFSGSSGAATVGGDVNIGSGSTLKLSTASGGDLNISGNFINNGTFNPNLRAVSFNNTTTPEYITGTTSFDYLTVNAGATVNSASNLTLNQIFTNNGGIFAPSGNVSFNNSVNNNQGSLVPSGAVTIGNGVTINNSSLISDTGTTTFAGTGTVSGSGNTNFLNVNISNGVNFGTHSTINGTLTINSGGYVNTNAPNYGNVSTLTYNTGGTYGANSEWTGNMSGGQGVPQNVVIQNNTTLNLNAADHTVRGNLLIGAGSTLQASSGHNLVVDGDFTNNGTYTPSNDTVIFDGGIIQTLTLANPTTFNNLTVMSPTTLNSSSTDYTVGGTLTINSGSVFNAPSGHNLTVSSTFTNSGTFNANAGTVTFGGGTNQNLTLNTPTTFNNLTVVTPTVLIETVPADNATVSGTLSNTGDIRKTQAIGGPGLQTFGLTAVAITVTDVTGFTNTLTSLQIDRFDSNAPNATDASLQTGRYWIIKANPNGGGYGQVTLPIPPSVPAATASVCDDPDGVNYGCTAYSYDTSTTPNTVSSIAVSLTDPIFLVGNAAPLAVKDLTASSQQLQFSATAGSTTAQQQSLSLTSDSNTPLNWTASIDYGNGPSSWLSLSPTSGQSMDKLPSKLTVKTDPTNLAFGTYTAQLVFTSSNIKTTVSVVLNVGFGSNAHTYYLPFLANNANGFSTSLTIQNMGTQPANFNVQYYNSQAGALNSVNINSLAANSEWQPSTNALPTNSSGAAILTSDQPLNLLVTENTPYGSSAYTVKESSVSAASSLVAPLAVNDAFGGFTSKLTVFNGGSTASNVSVKFYDANGDELSAADQNFSLAAHATNTVDESNINLPNGFNGWAIVNGSNGSQLVAQILEQRPDISFLALSNAQPLATASSNLTAPALFNKAYGNFYTGASIVNPSNQPVQVTISYYNSDGSALASNTKSYTLPANGVKFIYDGDNNLPSGFSGSAKINSSAPVVMLVNESGGNTVAGHSESAVYTALPSGANVIGLPVVAKNATQGLYTGSTLINLGSSAVTANIAFYDANGKQVTSNSFTLAVNARQDVYAGAIEALPSNFVGSAVVTVTSGNANQLAVMTNAVNPNSFYSYVEP